MISVGTVGITVNERNAGLSGSALVMVEGDLNRRRSGVRLGTPLVSQHVVHFYPFRDLQEVGPKDQGYVCACACATLMVDHSHEVRGSEAELLTRELPSLFKYLVDRGVHKAG